MNKSERDALFAVAGGVSEKSGLPLNAGWHADHIKPRAAGGSDDIVNMQALTPDENNQKSCGYVELRKWQAGFVRRFEAENAQDFLLVALPGSGKTIAALQAVKRWMQEKPGRRRVLIVVPTDNLRDQWKNIAHQLFGIELAIEEFTADASIFQPGNFDGACTTYQSVASNSLVYRALTSRYEFLVLFDEIHHAGDQASWGASMREAFSAVTKRLCMSGTPFRTDRSRIPFVPYDGQGMCRPSFTYDYPEALRDGIIRVVAFDHYAGAVSELDRITGQETIRQLNQEETDDQATIALSLILQHPAWQKGMLKIADEKLNALRQLKPNAGALALARDISHAEQIKKILEDITGEEPGLIVSDASRANVGITEWDKSGKKWLVAVRQVSEGTDIPRLMVLAYLTNTCTELFFKQAVGRIVRNQGEDFDGQAFCYIPDHPRLIEFAQRIKEAQCQSSIDDEEPEEEGAERDTQIDRLPRIILDTWAPEYIGRILDGDRFDPVISQQIDSLAAKHKTTSAVVAGLLRDFQSIQGNQATQQPHQAKVEAHTKPLHDQLRVLRCKAQRLVSKISRNTNEEHRFIRAKANRYAEKQGHAKATKEYLKAVVQFLADYESNS